MTDIGSERLTTSRWRAPGMDQYVALLRGINVGGKNLIPMASLRDCFENNGFKDVRTYIQSGNVLFTSKISAVPKLASKIEKALSARFRYQARVAVLSQGALRKIVRSAPKGFGANPSRFRFDVLFLLPPLSASEALKSVPTKPGVDQATAGVGAIYYSRILSKITQSRLSKLVSMPLYQSMTVRNWRTTTSLLEMMEKV